MSESAVCWLCTTFGRNFSCNINIIYIYEEGVLKKLWLTYDVPVDVSEGAIKLNFVQNSFQLVSMVTHDSTILRMTITTTEPGNPSEAYHKDLVTCPHKIK